MGNKQSKTEDDFSSFVESYVTIFSKDDSLKGKKVRVAFVDEHDKKMEGGLLVSFGYQSSIDVTIPTNHMRRAKFLVIEIVNVKTFSSKVSHVYKVDMQQIEQDFQYDFDVLIPSIKGKKPIDIRMKLFIRGKMTEKLALMEFADDTTPKQLILQSPSFSEKFSQTFTALHDRCVEFLSDHDDILVAQSINTHCLSNAHMVCIVTFKFHPSFVQQAKDMKAQSENSVRRSLIKLVIPPLPSEKYTTIDEYKDQIYLTAGKVDLFGDVPNSLILRVVLRDRKSTIISAHSCHFSYDQKIPFPTQELNVTSDCATIELEILKATLFFKDVIGKAVFPLPNKHTNQTFSVNLESPKGQHTGSILFHYNWPASQTANMPQFGYHYHTLSKSYEKLGNPEKYLTVLQELNYDGMMFMDDNMDNFCWAQLDTYESGRYMVTQIQTGYGASHQTHYHAEYSGYFAFCTVFWKAKYVPVQTFDNPVNVTTYENVQPLHQDIKSDV